MTTWFPEQARVFVPAGNPRVIVADAVAVRVDDVVYS
jgi:hypothetical protein